VYTITTDKKEKQKREIISNAIIFAMVAFVVFYINFTLQLVQFNNFILAGATATAFVSIRVMGKDKRKYRRGIEHGSARWGTSEDMKPYMDTNPRQNVILTATEGLTMNSRPDIPKYGRNKNMLVFGGAGSGKTRFFCVPNIMQMHSSYVITDPKGELFYSLGKVLEKVGGYDVRVLNLKDFGASMGYNPFDYIKTEDDILRVVNVLQSSTTENTKSSDDGDFWTKSEKLLYMALIAYIKFHVKDKTMHNMNTLVEMVTSMEVKEGDENYKSMVDREFERIEDLYPDDFSVRQYKKFKQGAGKTLKSIIISCGVRLAVFDIQAVRDVMEKDEMKLETIGDRKTALFVITDDTDSTYSFIATMLYFQMFSTLVNRAESKYRFRDGRLPVHVRCILDEFANLGKIPNFHRLIATIRSREISACIILQNLSQLKAVYKEHMNTIIGNCDTKLFLGGDDEETLKYLTRVMGKETIDMMDNSETKGKSGSFSKSYKKTGRELMTADELARLDGGKCLLILRGVPPFLSDKFDVTTHPVYRMMNGGIKKPSKGSNTKPRQQKATPRPRARVPPKNNTQAKIHKSTV